MSLSDVSDDDDEDDEDDFDNKSDEAFFSLTLVVESTNHTNKK